MRRPALITGMSDLISTGGGHNHPTGCTCPFCTSTAHTEPDALLMEPTDDPAAYAHAAEDVQERWLAMLESAGTCHGHGDHSENLRRIADRFENEAREVANTADPNRLSSSGDTVVNAETGTIRAACRVAAVSRLAADDLPGDNGRIDIATDALTEKVLDTRDFVAVNGVPFRARLVRKGAPWGRTGSLVAKEDTVFFFDARHPDHPPVIGHEFDDREAEESNGQHVANYYASTLNDHPPGAGLNLDTGVPDWQIDGETFADVLAWLGRRSRTR